MGEFYPEFPYSFYHVISIDIHIYVENLIENKNIFKYEVCKKFTLGVNAIGNRFIRSNNPNSFRLINEEFAKIKLEFEEHLQAINENSKQINSGISNSAEK